MKLFEMKNVNMKVNELRRIYDKLERFPRKESGGCLSQL